jgi:tellurite resistance-related uncharacterized protein
MLNNENYGYLVHPLSQFMDNNLKPLTSAYLKVFYAGTSASAYTYSDWEGTLNSSNIMLSMNGSANVIAEKDKAYKVMLCDALHPPSDPIWVKDNLYVISSEINLTFDTTPTADSTNPVTSGGIKTALNAKQDVFTIVDADASTTGSTVTVNIEQGDFYIVDLSEETSITDIEIVLTNNASAVFPLWWFKIESGSDATLSVKIGATDVGWLGSEITNIALGKTVEINVVDGIACGGELV